MDIGDIPIRTSPHVTSLQMLIKEPEKIFQEATLDEHIDLKGISKGCAGGIRLRAILGWIINMSQLLSRLNVAF